MLFYLASKQYKFDLKLKVQISDGVDGPTKPNHFKQFGPPPIDQNAETTKAAHQQMLKDKIIWPTVTAFLKLLSDSDVTTIPASAADFLWTWSSLQTSPCNANRTSLWAVFPTVCWLWIFHSWWTLLSGQVQWHLPQKRKIYGTVLMDTRGKMATFMSFNIMLGQQMKRSNSARHLWEECSGKHDIFKSSRRRGAN